MCLFLREDPTTGKSETELPESTQTYSKYAVRTMEVQEKGDEKGKFVLFAQFITVCRSAKRCDIGENLLTVPTRSSAHRRGSFMPVLSYVHQLFNGLKKAWHFSDNVGA